MLNQWSYICNLTLSYWCILLGANIKYFLITLQKSSHNAASFSLLFFYLIGSYNLLIIWKIIFDGANFNPNRILYTHFFQWLTDILLHKALIFCHFVPPFSFIPPCLNYLINSHLFKNILLVRNFVIIFYFSSTKSCCKLSQLHTL